jgi:hypothetical protein
VQQAGRRPRRAVSARPLQQDQTLPWPNDSLDPHRPPAGYKFQFVTLAGFHALNFSMFSLAREYAARGMAAYADLQVRGPP